MNLMEWSKSSVDYGHRLVSSALEGACEGEGEFLKDESLGPYLGESARHAFVPAVIGAYFGALGANLKNERRSAARTAAFSLFGGAVGFGLGLLWENREFIGLKRIRLITREGHPGPSKSRTRAPH